MSGHTTHMLTSSGDNKRYNSSAIYRNKLNFWPDLYITQWSRRSSLIIIYLVHGSYGQRGGVSSNYNMMVSGL